MSRFFLHAASLLDGGCLGLLGDRDPCQISPRDGDGAVVSFQGFSGEFLLQSRDFLRSMEQKGNMNELQRRSVVNITAVALQ